jgi:hypothetical protein
MEKGKNMIYKPLALGATCFAKKPPAIRGK